MFDLVRQNLARAQGGALFQAHAALSGWTMWMVCDENNRRIPVQDQHGRWLWGGWWNRNLITDVGLEKIATNCVLVESGGSGRWRSYSQIGTGSTAPAFTDTNLVTKVQSTNSNGGFGESWIDVIGTTIKREYTVNHLHTMTADRNLTEYGYSPDDAAGSTVIRELFRDQANNPVALTVLNGKKLQIIHRLDITLSPFASTAVEFEIEEYNTANALSPKITAATNTTPIQVTTDVAHGLATGNKVRIQNVGGNTAANGIWVVTVVDATNFTLDTSVGNGAYTSGGEMIRRYVGNQTWARDGTNTTTANYGQNSIFGVWDPTNVYAGGIDITDSGVINTTENDLPNDFQTTPAVAASSVALDAYVANSRERIKSIIFNEATGNAAAPGWRFVAYQGFGGFKVKLTNPPSFTKQSTHTLTIKLKCTWGRA